MGHFYPDNYGPYVSTRVDSSNEDPVRRTGLRRLLGVLAKKVFEFNVSRIPELPLGNMLEVGCASGSFLHLMASRGWKVQGIEFSETAGRAAQQLGYSVHIGSLESAPKPERRFDLIVGWMVIEHLHDPVGGLKKLAEWASPNASLIVSVPNAGSLEFRVFGPEWYALQLPTHLHHFTPDTISKMLEHTGWRVERVHHQRVINNLIGSIGLTLIAKGYTKIGNKLVKFPDQSGRWIYIFYPFAWLLGALGQTGRMTVWARLK
jgi:2-polyprenyl-3-methyl-5-hydroxy-6-metoxy-1,4-benzoquinol methylase